MTNETIGSISMAAFPLFFYGIMRFVARFGGWQKMADKFPAQYYGGSFFKTKSWQRIRLNGTTKYGGGITVKIGDMGFHMEPIWIFSAGHDPVFIPWKDVVGYEKQNLLIWSSLDVTLSNDVRITFNGETADIIFAELEKKKAPEKDLSF